MIDRVLPFKLFKFYIQVHANGVITFDSHTSALPEESFPNGTAGIAPFWTAVDQQSSPDAGSVYYRVTTDGNITNNISIIVRESFGEDMDFTASQMLIVTWDRVKGVNTDRVWSMHVRETEKTVVFCGLSHLAPARVANMQCWELIDCYLTATANNLQKCIICF